MVSWCLITFREYDVPSTMDSASLWTALEESDLVLNFVQHVCSPLVQTAPVRPDSPAQHSASDILLLTVFCSVHFLPSLCRSMIMGYLFGSRRA